MVNPMTAQLMAALGGGQQQMAMAPRDYSQMSDVELSRLSINDPQAARAMQERTRARQMEMATPAPMAPTVPLPTTTPGLAQPPTIGNQGGAMNMLSPTGGGDTGFDMMGAEPSMAAGPGQGNKLGKAWETAMSFLSPSPDQTPSTGFDMMGATPNPQGLNTTDTGFIPQEPGTTPFNPPTPPGLPGMGQAQGGMPVQSPMDNFPDIGGVVPGATQTEGLGPQTEKDMLLDKLLRWDDPSEAPIPSITRGEPEKGFLGKNHKALLEFGLALAAAGEAKPGSIQGPSLMGAIGQAGLRTTKFSRKREEKQYEREVAKETARATQERHRDNLLMKKLQLTETAGLKKEMIRERRIQNKIVNSLDELKLRATQENYKVGLANAVRAIASERQKAQLNLEEQYVGEKLPEALDRMHKGFDAALRALGQPVPKRDKERLVGHTPSGEPIYEKDGKRYTRTAR